MIYFRKIVNVYMGKALHELKLKFGITMIWPTLFPQSQLNEECMENIKKSHTSSA